MKWVAALCVFTFLLVAPASSVFMLPQTALSAPSVICNLNTGVATGIGGPTTCASPVAVCDGSTDTAAAFASFNNWAVNTWQASHVGQIGLTWRGDCKISSGTVACNWNSSNLNCPFINIKNLLVYGVGTEGSTLTAPNSFISLGGIGIQSNVNTTSARTATVSAGANCVTLLTASDASRFTAGLYVIMTGFSIQAGWQDPEGYPPNLHYFEYIKVASVSSTLKCDGTSGASVTFASNLVNTYKSTWPSYFAGDAGHYDIGGPATLYYLDPSWDTTVEIRDITLNAPGQTEIIGRSGTFRNVVFIGAACGIPSQNLLFRLINMTGTLCQLEMDKLVSSVHIIGGTVAGIDFPSSSIDEMVMDGVNITGYLHGTPKRSYISNSTIPDFRPGAYAYGRSDVLTCTTCVLAVINPLGITEKGPADVGVNIAYTMSGGVITVPNTYGAVRWAVPNTNLMWQGQYETETGFYVVDVTQDANNVYVQTNLAGGFPSVPLTSGLLFIKVHPAPFFTCRSCSGSADAVDFNQATALAPMYSYSKRVYTQATLTGPAANSLTMWGAVTSFGVNVTTAYAGAGSLTLHATAQFDNTQMIKSDYSAAPYGPNINMKAAGNRVITGATCPGAGCTGNQTGDSGLGLPQASAWFTGTQLPFLSADVSASGTFNVTIEIQSNQGVVSP